MLLSTSRKAHRRWSRTSKSPETRISPPAQLTAPKGFELRAGVPFSPRKLAEDRNRISATYLNRGYLNAEVKTIVKQNPGDPHRVSCRLCDHRDTSWCESVKWPISGQKQTRLSLIKKTAQIPPETPMRRDQLLEAESRLYDLGIFDWSSVGPRKPITDQTDEMALVKVHEAKRNEITYGFGFEVSHRGGNIPTGTVALPGGGGTIGLGGNQIAPSQSTFASPTGSGSNSLAATCEVWQRPRARPSSCRASINERLTTYSQPHFIGSQWQSLTSFSVERNSENPLFTAGLGDLSFQLERLISRKNEHPAAAPL